MLYFYLIFSSLILYDFSEKNERCIYENKVAWKRKRFDGYILKKKKLFMIF